MQRVALFDLDKTITTKDSGGVFLRGWIVRRPWLIWRLVVGVFAVLGWKAGLLRLRTVKRIFFGVVNGIRVERLDRIGARFVERHFARLVKPEAAALVRRLQRAGFTVVLLSASPVWYVRHFARRLGIPLYDGTRYRIRNGRYRGGLQGVDCRGAEKVRRLRRLIDMQQVDWAGSLAFSDSEADLPMLRLAGHPFMVEPDSWHPVSLDRIHKE